MKLLVLIGLFLSFSKAFAYDYSVVDPFNPSGVRRHLKLANFWVWRQLNLDIFRRRGQLKLVSG